MDWARTGYRQAQEERLKAFEAENPRLQREVELCKARYDGLNQRSLCAYNAQQELISKLKQELETLKSKLGLMG